MTFQVTIILGLGFVGFLTTILLVYFYYDRLIGIFLMGFLTAILNCNSRLRTSDFKFQKSLLSFCTFKYIYICLSNGIVFRVPRTHIDLSFY